MGEVDLSVAVESETLRYLQNGYPLKIIYPADGTSWLLTGFGITTKDAEKNLVAAKFADWLLSDEAQLYLQRRSLTKLSREKIFSSSTRAKIFPPNRSTPIWIIGSRMCG